MTGYFKKLLCFVFSIQCILLPAQVKQKVDSLLLRLNDKALKAQERPRIIYRVAKLYLNNNDSLSYQFCDSAINEALKHKNAKVEGEALSLQGVIHKNRGEFKKAIEKHLSALKIKEGLADTMGVAICYNDIGVLNKVMKNYTTALEYYRKSNALCRQINLGKGIAQTYNNIGTIFTEQGLGDSALFYYKKALEVAEKINNKAAISTVCNNIGEYYGNHGNDRMAIVYFNKCLALDIEEENINGMTMSYLNLGGAYTKLGEFDKAIDVYSKAETLCMQNNEVLMLKDLYNSLSENYARNNNKAKAYEYLKKYRALNDSLQGDELRKSILEVETKYQSQKKDNEILKQKSELRLKEDENRRKNLVIWFVILLALVLVLALVFYMRQRQARQQLRLEAQLTEQKEIRAKAIIEAEEKERIRIAKDLHDGVGQLLSAAKMNLSSLENKVKLEGPEDEAAFKNALDLMNESVKEVRAVSHNMMPHTLLKLGLASAVREFVTKLQGTPSLKVNLEIVGLEGRLEQEKESVLYRVIQELVSNVIKHAKASVIGLQLIRHDKELTIVVEDNGVGFDVSQKENFEGMGLKNIISRIEFVNGSVNFDSTPGKGTTVIIEMPV